jgi:hypothetical protein
MGCVAVRLERYGLNCLKGTRAHGRGCAPRAHLRSPLTSQGLSIHCCFRPNVPRLRPPCAGVHMHGMRGHQTIERAWHSCKCSHSAKSTQPYAQRIASSNSQTVGKRIARMKKKALRPGAELTREHCARPAPPPHPPPHRVLFQTAVHNIISSVDAPAKCSNNSTMGYEAMHPAKLSSACKDGEEKGRWWRW